MSYAKPSDKFLASRGISLVQQLTEDQIDALKELINIGVGRAASLLNEMVGFPIHLEIPFIQVFAIEDLQQELIARFNQNYLATVRLGFTGSINGSAELVFPTESASTLVSVLTGEDLGSPDLDAVKIGTLTEVGNIVINGVIGSLGNLLKQRMNYLIPTYTEDTVENLFAAVEPDDSTIVLAQASFTIEQLQVIGDLIFIFELQTFDQLIAAIEEMS
ncbi:chemotaxis protein CheC [Chroococcidiopsis sp [FACHB-1243]]|uniref:chemotaxis protein CheC n=1 Tax=Chroococcidiopsis sp. [FACHB-1243] TaxID=2692781 RepID=UPI0018EFE2AD|nr:chemotaxis protein CheC [Chroococcidiopsis sp. [FACHB-1243]]